MADIRVLTTASAQAALELAGLASTLHEDTRSLSESELKEIVSNPNIVLATVEDGGRIVGMGTLYVIPKIGKKNAYIEDVIVDDAYRGQGLGEALTRKLIDEARDRGLGSISLTSRSHRVAAHKLYTKLGFKLVETNVFKLTL